MNGIRRFFAIDVLFIFLLCSTMLYAQTECKQPEARIVDHGIYESVKGERVTTKNVTTGYNTVVYSKKLVEETTTVAATIGTQFGFRYSLKCEKDDLNYVPVTIKVFHPEMTNPATGVKLKESFWTDNAWTFQTNIHSGWSFDESWEVVPGKFLIQVILDDTLLLEKEFTIEVAK